MKSLMHLVASGNFEWWGVCVCACASMYMQQYIHMQIYEHMCEHVCEGMTTLDGVP